MNKWNNAYTYVIGINKYEKLSTLSFCVNDALLISDTLTGKLSNAKLKLLLSNGETDEPSDKNIKKLLDEIAGLNLSENDIILFYFAGHGFSEGGIDYLTCSNTDSKNLSETSISTDSIIAAFNKSHVGTSVLIIDACRNNVDRGISRELFSKSTSELARRNGIITFFSCSPSEYSQELSSLDKGHGIFTYSFIKSLTDGDITTAVELNRLTIKNVKDIINLNNLSEQNPYTVVAPLEKANLDIITNRFIEYTKVGRRKCILIAGSTNAGKSTLGQYISSKHGFIHVEMSSFAYNRFNQKPIDYDGNIQDFMEDEVWQNNSKDIIAQDLLSADLDHQNLVITGPRLPEEVETLLGQDWNVIPLFLFSDTTARFKRYQKDKGISRYDLNFREFIQKDMRELGWGIAKTATMSQLDIMVNSRSLDDLFSNFNKMFEKQL